MKKIIIIGSGLGGYTVAKELSQHNNSEITLITEDDGVFYSKPELSILAANNKTTKDMLIFTSKEMESKYNFKIINNTKVKNIFEKENTIQLDNSQILFYDYLILAIGAKPNKLSFNDVHSVNNLNDYKLIEKLNPQKIALIGSGVIGVEFAESFLTAKKEVSIFSTTENPLQNLIPKDVSIHLKEHLEAKGLKWHNIDSIKNIEKTISGLKVNNVGNFDVVLSSIGITPNIELLNNTQIKTNKGIIVNNNFQTNLENIYAIGDCIEHNNNFYYSVEAIFHASKKITSSILGIENNSNFDITSLSIKTLTFPITLIRKSFTKIDFWEQNNDFTYFGFKNNKKNAICITKKISFKEITLHKENLSLN